MTLKTALFTFLVLSSSLTYAQNITFEQAQDLRKKSLAEVETFLTSKEWSMTDAKEATSDKMGYATFGYKVNKYDSEKAEGWISFIESSVNNNYNRISILIFKQDLYSTFLKRLAVNSYELKSSKIEDGGIKKIYKNATTTCVVTTGTSEGVLSKITYYQFFFIDNFSYEINYGKEE